MLSTYLKLCFHQFYNPTIIFSQLILSNSSHLVLLQQQPIGKEKKFYAQNFMNLNLIYKSLIVAKHSNSTDSKSKYLNQIVIKCREKWKVEFYSFSFFVFLPDIINILSRSKRILSKSILRYYQSTAKIICTSPWTDLTSTKPSNKKFDPQEMLNALKNA